MAKKTKKNEGQNFYSRILSNTQRRSGLFLLIPIIVVVFTLVIFGYLMKGETWYVIAGPISLIGIVLMLYPQTEEWEYVPWQTHAQQYERHFNERPFPKR